MHTEKEKQILDLTTLLMLLVFFDGAELSRISYNRAKKWGAVMVVKPPFVVDVDGFTNEIYITAAITSKAFTMWLQRGDAVYCLHYS